MTSKTIKQRLQDKLTRSDWIRLSICGVILLPLIWLFVNVPKEKGFAIEENFWFWMREHIPPWAGQIIAFVYDFGDKEISALVVAGSLGFLLWKRRWWDSLLMAIATSGALFLVDKVFKPNIARLRPPYFKHEYGSVPDIIGLAFPSGHATGNVALYCVLSTLLVQKFPRYTLWIYAGMVSFILLMGLGSLYLGVHWPTDIIGGYGLGFIWFTLCYTVIRLLAPQSQSSSK